MIPNSVTHIDSSAFENCTQLYSLTLSNNLTSIGSSAFKGCSNLISITIPNSVTHIDSSAFECCFSLNNILINEGLISIGSRCFKNCVNIDIITIPYSLLYIGISAFEGCISLENVIVLRDETELTNLGENSFLNCNGCLKIQVPKVVVYEYKNKIYWSDYDNIIIPADINDDIFLDYLSDEHIDLSLNIGEDSLYRISTNCCGIYTFITSANSRIIIYDSDMLVIETIVSQLDLFLNSNNVYYVVIEPLEYLTSGDISVRILNKGIEVFYNLDNNLLSYLHETETHSYKVKLKYNNIQGAGFYKFLLNGVDNNNVIINYNQGSIIMYEDYNRNVVMNKYDNNNLSLVAETYAGENEMIVYLPSNGFYYFDVCIDNNDLFALTINISPLCSYELDLFTLSESSNQCVNVFENSESGDCIDKIILNQSGKFTVHINYGGIILSDIYVVICKVVYNVSNNSYLIDQVYSCILNINNTSAIGNFTLKKGEYFIGYFNKNDGEDVSISFERIISNYGSQYLISDPDCYTEYGSEVRFNNGVYQGNTLTVGFSRFIYLNNSLAIPSQSRLDYEWYSSDDDIASISIYGTLFGKTDGIVKIMAVYKYNPAITFVKQFIVLADTRIEDLINYVYNYTIFDGVGTTFIIELNDTNSYFPQNTLYDFTIMHNEVGGSVSSWGTITINGIGDIVISARSKINSKLVLWIIVHIT